VLLYAWVAKFQAFCELLLKSRKKVLFQYKYFQKISYFARRLVKTALSFEQHFFINIPYSAYH